MFETNGISQDELNCKENENKSMHFVQNFSVHVPLFLIALITTN